MSVPELTIVIMGQSILGSVILIPVIQKLKTWLQLSGGVVTLLTFVLGAVLGALGFMLRLVSPETTLIYAILQGLVSAFIATGSYDLLFKK